MTQVARPQEEKNNVPWRITFTRKDLLAAAWQSKKGADLLYHFLHRASWEAKNQKLAADATTISFQEERPKLFEAMAKTGKTLSQGSYNTLLRCFGEVGYVTNEPYSDVFTVHTDIIAKAFTKPPQKPVRNGEKPNNTDESCVKMTHRHTDTISREEYNSMHEVCVNLSKMCQNLSIQVAELTQLCQSLTQNTSGSTAQEAPLVANDRGTNHALDNANANAFLGAHDQSSYSQQTSEPTPEKNENDSRFEMPTFYAALPIAWLQEESSANVNSSSQENVPTQDMPATAELFPPPAKPTPAHVFPDLRAGLNERDVRQITTAEQKRIDAAEQRQKEQREKKRTLEVWELFDTLFGSSVDRYGYNKPHVLSLAKNTLATDAVITTAFNAVANSQAVKNNPAKLTITEVTNVVPSYIRAEQIKVVSSHNKPKSFEEQYAESERATKEFEAKERAGKERRAREEQERMAMA